MVDPSDRSLVIQARRGNVESFGVLVQRFQKSVFNVCLRMLGDRMEAEDLAQETFIRTYKKLGTYDVDRPFGPWIRKVATNLCLNHLQRKKPSQIPLDNEIEMTSDPKAMEPEKEVMKAERAEEIREALMDLPPNYRAVIELRHYQDLSYSEISEVLGISLSNVKSWLFRARKSLATRLVHEPS